MKKAAADTCAPDADDIRRVTGHKSMLQPLTFLTKHFHARIGHALRQRGHHLQPAHSKIVVHLDMEGTRLTDLAERAGISKQAMGKMVDELENLGYVCRDDHSDGRAKNIRFTRKGIKLLKDSDEIVDQVWGDCAALFGEQRLTHLRNELSDLQDIIRQDADNPFSSQRAAGDRRQQSAKKK